MTAGGSHAPSHATVTSHRTRTASAARCPPGWRRRQQRIARWRLYVRFVLFRVRSYWGRERACWRESLGQRWTASTMLCASTALKWKATSAGLATGQRCGEDLALALSAPHLPFSIWLLLHAFPQAGSVTHCPLAGRLARVLNNIDIKLGSNLPGMKLLHDMKHVRVVAPSLRATRKIKDATKGLHDNIGVGTHGRDGL